MGLRYSLVYRVKEGAVGAEEGGSTGHVKDDPPPLCVVF